MTPLYPLNMGFFLRRDVKRIKKGEVCKWYHVCPIKRFTDKGLLDKRWVEQYCLRGNTNCVRYQMEEKGQFHPDNMLPDGTLDHRLAE